jgi:5'-methylthioadenosine phosphorylase
MNQISGGIMQQEAVGIIGGTGFYEIPGAKVIRQVNLDTPFGAHSGPIVEVSYNDQPVYFMPRHGAHHELLPHELNFRANIFALKSLGVTRCLSICACGSMKEEIAPGDYLFADQIIDFTVRRNITFLGQGLSAYPSLAKPLDQDISRSLIPELMKHTAARIHPAGAYLCIEGPHLSSRAESEIFRGWNASIIGMTACPEVRLACEAQISFVLLGMVSDYDCWNDTHEAVSVAQVMEVLKTSTQEVRAALPDMVSVLQKSQRSEDRANALKSAMMIDPAEAPRQEVLSVLLR